MLSFLTLWGSAKRVFGRQAGLPPIPTRRKGRRSNGISPHPNVGWVYRERNGAPSFSNRAGMDYYLFLLNLLTPNFSTNLQQHLWDERPIP